MRFHVRRGLKNKISTDKMKRKKFTKEVIHNGSNHIMEKEKFDRVLNHSKNAHQNLSKVFN